MRRSRPDPMLPLAVRVRRPALELQSVTNEELYDRYCDYLIAQHYPEARGSTTAKRPSGFVIFSEDRI
jgi:hypothetical protein